MSGLTLQPSTYFGKRRRAHVDLAQSFARCSSPRARADDPVQRPQFNRTKRRLGAAAYRRTALIGGDLSKVDAHEPDPGSARRGRRIRHSLRPTASRHAVGIEHSGFNMITKMLVSAAIVVGSCAVRAAPASADPNQPPNDPNPFGGLTCSCQEPAPPAGPGSKEELERGIRAGLSAGEPPAAQ
jgi:hypothetical protein